MTELERFKKEQTKVAKELLYPESVIERIKKAKSIYEIDRIMIQARRDKT